jgi:hypothetical protein
VIAALLLLAAAPQPDFDRNQWVEDVKVATDVWKLCLREVADDWAHRKGTPEAIADQVIEQCDHVYRDVEQVYRKGPGVTEDGLAFIRSRARLRWRPEVVVEIRAKRRADPPNSDKN